MSRPRLLAIVELGGYPNLLPLYQRLGFEVDLVSSQRRARTYLNKTLPDVIVAEYNYQTDFRDRSSNLETLMAILQKHPQVKLVVFYMPQHSDKLERFKARFPVHAAIPFPVSAASVEQALSGFLSLGVENGVSG